MEDCSPAVYSFILADLLLICACVYLVIHNERNRCMVFAEFLRKNDAAADD